jgi:hypothetical protein
LDIPANVRTTWPIRAPKNEMALLNRENSAVQRHARRHFERRRHDMFFKTTTDTPQAPYERRISLTSHCNGKFADSLSECYYPKSSRPRNCRKKLSQCRVWLVTNPLNYTIWELFLLQQSARVGVKNIA